MKSWSLRSVYYCYKWEITNDPNANLTLLYEQANGFRCHKVFFFLLCIARVTGSGHFGKPVSVLFRWIPKPVCVVYSFHDGHFHCRWDVCYTDKSLARPGRKQANVSVRIAWISFCALPCKKKKKKLDDSSRLDVVEIARVPDMLPSLFTSWSG